MTKKVKKGTLANCLYRISKRKFPELEITEKATFELVAIVQQVARLVLTLSTQVYPRTLSWKLLRQTCKKLFPPRIFDSLDRFARVALSSSGVLKGPIPLSRRRRSLSSSESDHRHPRGLTTTIERATTPPDYSSSKRTVTPASSCTSSRLDEVVIEMVSQLVDQINSGSSDAII